MSTSPLPTRHFVGIAGNGMSALAAYAARSGRAISGSDRAFDRGQLQELRGELVALGVRIDPQDGSGVDRAKDIVTSTAVEAHIPDLARAREQHKPILHRSEVLAEELAAGPSIAIAGTSGKSTTTALVFHLLEGLGEDPGLIGGAPLVGRKASHLDNGIFGRGPVVAEADESDGTLVRYQPELAVVLNIHPDHMPEERIQAQFQTFLAQARGQALLGLDRRLDALSPRALRIDDRPGADFFFEPLPGVGTTARGRLDGCVFEVPLAGRHNAENAAVALAVAKLRGHPLPQAIEVLARFPGVHRRFQRIGEARGITIFDDYAHNPDKLAAAIRAATELSPRVIAFWQPHGFGPLRFLFDTLVQGFARALRPQDLLVLGPIHDAGGTARRDIAARDLLPPLRGSGVHAVALAHRDDLIALLRERGGPGDVALLMGARDGTLASFAREVHRGLAL